MFNQYENEDLGVQNDGCRCHVVMEIIKHEVEIEYELGSIEATKFSDEEECGCFYETLDCALYYYEGSDAYRFFHDKPVGIYKVLIELGCWVYNNYEYGPEGDCGCNYKILETKPYEGYKEVD